MFTLREERKEGEKHGALFSPSLLGRTKRFAIWRMLVSVPAMKSMPPSTQTTPAFIAMLQQRWRHDAIPAWILLPLRLFLGVTFVYAGLQKLTDPQFFKPSAVGYIGKQIAAFATSSPIRGLLVNVALPHAQFFGALIAYGEFAIGLGVLLGFLMRPAAFFGLLLSVMFFLSASWRVRPYFYGADIVFAFAWVPILLAGPEHGILPTVDPYLAAWVLDKIPPKQRAGVERAVQFVLGVGAPATSIGVDIAPPIAIGSTHKATKPVKAGIHAVARPSARQVTKTRRDFLWGIVAGGAGMLGLSWLWGQLQLIAATPVPTGAGSGTVVAGTANPVATTNPTTIAQIANVPVNSAVTFTIPSNQDPGVLVHTNAGKFVAFDATCTHQGCPVQYDPGSQLLQCPCHGAAFDPAQNAAVVQGPTNQPLAPVAITIDQQTGTISVQ